MEKHIKGTNVELIQKWIKSIELLITPGGDKLYCHEGKLYDYSMPYSIIVKLDLLQSIVPHTDDPIKKHDKPILYAITSGFHSRVMESEAKRVRNYLDVWKILLEPEELEPNMD